MYFGIKRIEDQEAQKKQVCVGLQTECNVTGCCVRKLRWVFPAAVRRRTSHASDAGFPCVNYPRPMLLLTASFSVRTCC